MTPRLFQICIFLGLAGSGSACPVLAQRSACWQRACPNEIILKADTALPGVTNAWTNILAFSTWSRAHGLPTFTQYPVAPATQPLSLATPLTGPGTLAHTYRTAVRRRAKTGSDFAGHYTVVTVGCGSPCVRLLIADQLTGQVFLAPEQLVRPPMYRLDSALLVEDPTGFMTDSLGHPGFPLVRYWHWAGGSLHVVVALSADSLPLRVAVQ